MGWRRTRMRLVTSVALALTWSIACGASDAPSARVPGSSPGTSGQDQSGAPNESDAGAPSDAGFGGGHGGETDSRSGAPGAAGKASGGGAAGAGEGTPPNAGMGGENETVRWSGSIGALCSSDDRSSLWLVMSPQRASCATRSHALTDDGSDFIRAELPATSEAELRDLSGVRARYCAGGRCRDAELAVALVADQAGTTGTFSLSADGKPLLNGELTTAHCAWNDYLASPSPTGPGVRGLSLQSLALFQGVKVPLMELGRALAPGRAGVVAGRDALVRAYVEPGSDWSPRPIRAELTLDNAGATTTFEDTKTLAAASDDSSLDSTFDFRIPAGQIRTDTQYSVALYETVACAATGERAPGRFPDAGASALGAADVGGISVEIIPVRIRSLPGDLLPDTSPAQIELLRAKLVSLFPITGADVRVRSTPLDSTASTALEVLDDVSALRDEEAPDRRLSYYGLFQLTETLDEYCMGSCVLGAGIVGDPTAPNGGTAVGIGYTGDTSARTFSHELGHVYGSQHSPCNTAGDPDYPYSGGRIGVWGYDLASGTLMPPTDLDLMSYCTPYWVSDYVFGHLATFIGALNTDIALAYVGEPAQFRTILLEPRAPAHFGRPHAFTGLPPGEPEPALAFGPNGNATSLVAYRADVGEGGALVYVPDPAVHAWSSVRLADGRLVTFDAGTNTTSP